MPPHPAFVYFHYSAATPVAVRVRDGFAARWAEVGRLPHSFGSRIADVVDGDSGCAAFAGFLSDPKQQEAARPARCPVINYSNRNGLFAQGRNILADDAEVGRLAAEHLLAKGHRKFAFVEDEPSGFARERGDAFVKALRRAGHTAARLTFSPPEGLNPVEYDAQRLVDMAGWMERLEPPLGVLAANDMAAANFLQFAEQAAPETVPLLAVIGVDNAPPRTFAFPEPGYLSSIEPDFRAVGAAIAEELAGILAGKPFTPGSVRWVPGARLIERESTGGVSCADPLVARLMRQIQREVEAGEAPRVDALAARFGTTTRTLLARFSRETGKSLREHILGERLRRAAALLRDGAPTVAEVAYACGFGKQGALSSHFKRQYGCTPSAFQAAGRG